MAFVLLLQQQNQTFKVMKTSTVFFGSLLSLSFLVIIATTEAFSHPNHYYNRHGERLGWEVPEHVLYSVNRAYYNYDLVHVRQVRSGRFVDFEFVLERRGRFLAVYADHHGRVLRSTWIASAPFVSHSCDMYCGFHGDQYQRYYRPRPVVIVNNRPPYGNHGHGKGHGHGKNKHWDSDDHKHDYRGKNNNYKEYDSDGYRRGRSSN